MMSDVTTNTTQQLLPTIPAFTSALNTTVIVPNSLATGEKSPWNYGLELLVPHTTAL